MKFKRKSLSFVIDLFFAVMIGSALFSGCGKNRTEGNGAGVAWNEFINALSEDASEIENTEKYEKTEEIEKPEEKKKQEETEVKELSEIDGVKAEADVSQKPSQENMGDSEPKSSSDNLKIYDAYLSSGQIMWAGESFDADGISFLLVDIDRDGSPELFLQNSLASHAQSSNGLFGVKDGNVVEFLRNDEIEGYYPEHKIVKANYYGMGSMECYYKIENGVSKGVLTKSISYLDETTTETYYSDEAGNDITEEEFEQKLRNYIEGEEMTVLEGDLLKNTEENRAKSFR